MKPFTYTRAADAVDAVSTVTADPDARFLAGGSNLVDHLKLGIATPQTLVDVRHLPLNAIEDLPDGGLRVGANVLNSDLASHRRVRAEWPVVARALLSGASAQLRHQATTGGNLMQRTRCVYFQDRTTPCNKREPGSGCSALEGYDRYNAVLGATPSCVAVHPSDFAVALAAVDGVVVTLRVDGERRTPAESLHRLPGDDPSRDTELDHGELVTGVELSPRAAARRSTYVKVRDRASYAFALVSVAAGLELDEDGVVRDVRLVWGGVAHKPWRATTAEELLRGRPLTDDAVRAAADEELGGARTTAGTAYKPAMVRNATSLAFHRLTGALGEGSG